MNETLDRARLELGQSLPHIAGAILLLILGLLAAWIAGIIVGRALRAVGIDPLADRFGIHRTLQRLGVSRPLSRLLRTITTFLIAVVVVVAALSLLGLSAVDIALNEAILFVPKLLVALALIVAGVIVGELAGNYANRLAKQLAVEAPVGTIVEATVITLAALTALAQVGVPTEIVTALLAVAIIAVALTGTLAFGLGGRELAGQVSAGRHVHASYQLGQTISLNHLTAEIIAFESAATVVRLPDGRTARVPNSHLLNSVVIVETMPPQTAPRSY